MKHRWAIATVLGIIMSACGFAAGQKTITGWVLDSACAFTKGLNKPLTGGGSNAIVIEKIAEASGK